MEEKVRKIPMRQCLGCNEHVAKKDLLRAVRLPDGGVVLDFTGKKSGRGAYLCRNPECLKKARKSRRLEKNLECTIPENVWDEMERELISQDGEAKG